ncbi:MAG TPA: OmpA family protein [Bacteroidia bacterium]|nr:OmpA family protein [Bacteroidia bacterium]
MTRKLFAAAIVVMFVLSACVPQRKHQEVLDKLALAEKTRDSLKTRCMDYDAKQAELDKQIKECASERDKLKVDTMGCGMRYRILTMQYNQLTANYELLLKQNQDLAKRQTTENSALVGKLNLTQEELFRKEDSLKKLDVSLKAQKRSLDSLNAILFKREMRVRELERALAAKDSAVTALQNKVKNALIGFEGKGLTVTQKNGKVYVSMDDKLMFASGSTSVQTGGVSALVALAKVLVQNPDINIMVEGHTDDVPMKGSGEIKDNWDLSVMRATSVTKILIQNGVDPKRITAAGRGEHFPVDPAKTAEARAKNRRTEIILIPNLDDLFKVLEPTNK